MTFYSWLMKNKYRADPIGDIARDAERDKEFPRRVKTPQEVRQYLVEKGACKEAIRSARESWREFESYVGGPSQLEPGVWIYGDRPSKNPKFQRAPFAKKDPRL